MEPIYLGRMVAVGLTPAGNLTVLYRVSSRSFPNREARLISGKIAIVPKAGHESDVYINPYISYNCAAIVNDTAILSNGSHTDPIAEKIAGGASIRDAFALGLLAMDYEKDAYNTPRIVVAARLNEKDKNEKIGWLGIVRKDGIEIRALPLVAGKVFYLSTYQRHFIREEQCVAIPELTAETACQFILTGGEFANFTNPITAGAAVSSIAGFALAAVNLVPHNEN